MILLYQKMKDICWENIKFVDLVIKKISVLTNVTISVVIILQMMSL